ncbi:MAG TPA: DUF493 domain-containing protein, partial [Chromatiales bacterium]|nr:DUF493 domain-containing protein [Chromatiales bacterium]
MSDDPRFRGDGKAGDPLVKPSVAEDETSLERETLIEFPSEFPVKIMGPATDAFVNDIRQAVTTVLG